MSIEEKIINLEKRIARLEQLESEKLLTVSEVAQMLKSSVSSIYKGIAAGRIPAKDVNGLLRVKKSDIIDLAQSVKIYNKY